MENWEEFGKWCQKHHAAALTFIATFIALTISFIGLPSSIVDLKHLLNPPNPQQGQTEKGNGREETHVLHHPPLNKAGVFVHSSINSTLGDDLAGALTRSLENLGLSVASDRTDAGFDIEIKNLKIDGPRHDTDGRVSWTTTVNLNILIRQVKDAIPTVTKDFPGTATPFAETATTDDSNTSQYAALLKVTDSVARYLDNNRQALNLHSH
ncbi:MAG: hypothetical protein ACREDM_00095 [Methylocella sp.]